MDKDQLLREIADWLSERDDCMAEISYDEDLPSPELLVEYTNGPLFVIRVEDI